MGFLLDFKLAVRMLVKYPLLTIVGGAGMAFGIAAGVGGYELRAQLIDPTLPLEEGHRIVGLRYRDIRADRAVPSTDADFQAWSGRLKSFESLAAVALVERNLTVNGATEPIAVAEMTASAFRVTRVLPLIGRRPLESDELAGAAPVALIGQTLWQQRFSSDPAVVGRSVRLGTEETIIIGVMPKSFAFPAAHRIWIPLRRQSTGARSLLVFGRLAPGVTLSAAQAEFATVGEQTAAATGRQLRAEVVPFTRLISDPGELVVGATLANVFLIMLIVVVAANVGLLMFARATSRESEIVVRAALGASRGRIVSQLFVEALALSGLSVIAGLAGARLVIGSMLSMMEADSGATLPFWMNNNLSPATIGYSVLLTILGAVIIGVLPALKVTGARTHARLKQFTAGGGGYRFGGIWTAVIAAQVAVTVLFPASAFFFHRWVVQGQNRDVGFAAREYLSARLELDPANGRIRTTLDELRRQLIATPGVTGVTFANFLPGTQHPRARFEIEGDQAPQASGYEVRIASIDADFFSALDAPALSGRLFTAADFTAGREVAIVNSSFVDRVLHGRNPVGRQIRRVAADSDEPSASWIEIVGVVRDLGVVGTNGIGIYRPLAVASSTVNLAIHSAGGLESLTTGLRAIALKVDPTLRVYDMKPLDQVGADLWLESQYLSRALTVLSVVAMLLSLMAIYAVMSFTVVQRTREIGTRVVLGANPRQITTSIILRPLAQIGLGILAGGALVALFFVGLFESAPTAIEGLILSAYALVMLTVCLSACVGPIRRALRLDLSQVLRAD